MSVIPIPGDMTEIELRKLVVKDADERLRAELKRGQTHFDSSTIEGMSRDDLVANVTLLRRLAGQTNAVQTVVTTFTGLSKPSVTPQPSATASAASVQPPSDGSIAAILALLMQQQESARQERAERDAKEERLMQLAKQEKAELLLKAKQEKEQKEAKEKQEKAELLHQVQLEREERVEAARLEADRVRLALLEADKERQIVHDIQDRSNRLAEEEAAAAERRHRETMA